jgi:hypothetical protein
MQVCPEEARPQAWPGVQVEAAHAPSPAQEPQGPRRTRLSDRAVLPCLSCAALRLA